MVECPSATDISGLMNPQDHPSATANLELLHARPRVAVLSVPSLHVSGLGVQDTLKRGGLTFCLLTAASIKTGALTVDEFDALVVPGGDSTPACDALGQLYL